MVSHTRTNKTSTQARLPNYCSLTHVFGICLIHRKPRIKIYIYTVYIILQRVSYCIFEYIYIHIHHKWDGRRVASNIQMKKNLLFTTHIIWLPHTYPCIPLNHQEFYSEKHPYTQRQSLANNFSSSFSIFR